MSRSIKGSEITPETLFWNRRRFLAGSAAVAGGLLTPGCGDGAASAAGAAAGTAAAGAIPTPLTPTAEELVTSYNNFYEFGTGKDDPKRYAHEMTVSPWSVEVAGEAEKTGVFDLDDLLKGLTPEERVYRFRCVEAWSMVVPWLGIPLASIIKRLQPTSNARYLEFTTLYRPEELRGQRSVFSSIDWPYVEGLRLDEAMHPLTLMAVGVYGKDLPEQNGAPWRLVVPWKIRLQEHQVGGQASLYTTKPPKTPGSFKTPANTGSTRTLIQPWTIPRWSQGRETTPLTVPLAGMAAHLALQRLRG